MCNVLREEAYAKTPIQLTVKENARTAHFLLEQTACLLRQQLI